MELKKGNIEDLRASINERIDLVLLKKDFAGKIFSRIKLTGANIASCKFNDCGFYGVEFIDTELTSNSFKNANFDSCTFTNCTVYKCDFEKANLQNVKFNDCRILDCRWVDVKMAENITGLSDEDLKVIHEGTEIDQPFDLTQMGFEKIDDHAYEICDQQEGVSAPKICLIVAREPEMSDPTNDVYRVMFEINDECILSETFDVNENVDYEEVYDIIKYVLISGKNKTMKPDFENKDGLQYDLLKKSVDIIKSKLVFNSQNTEKNEINNEN